MEGLLPRVKEDNPDPRVACALVLDTSASMSGEPISELSAAFELFCTEIQADPLARKRTEVAVITVGGIARVEISFTEGRELEPISFIASGGTPLGAGINLAIDELLAQKQAYRAAGLEYYRPWLFVLSDGSPTDPEAFEGAARRVQDLERRRGISVFVIAIGDADITYLSQLSALRQPLTLRGLSFQELFLWLSKSMTVVSQSAAFGSDVNGEILQHEDQVPLPSPAGWATW